jgi:hypothetical protein
MIFQSQIRVKTPDNGSRLKLRLLAAHLRKEFPAI